VATIDDLNKSICDMTNDEAYTLLKELRQNRRTSKKKPTERRKAKSIVEKMLSKITPEMAKQLLEVLDV
jgi:hypothetical protein